MGEKFKYERDGLTNLQLVDYFLNVIEAANKRNIEFSAQAAQVFATLHLAEVIESSTTKIVEAISKERIVLSGRRKPI